VEAAAAVPAVAEMAEDAVVTAEVAVPQSGTFPSLWWRWGRHRRLLVASSRLQILGRFRTVQRIRSCCCKLCRSQLQKSMSRIRRVWL